MNQPFKGFAEIKSRFPSSEYFEVELPCLKSDALSIVTKCIVFLNKLNKYSFNDKLAETLLFIGPKVSSDESKVTLCFVHRQEGWNKVYRDESARWEEIVFAETGNPLYGSISYADMLAFSLETPPSEPFASPSENELFTSTKEFPQMSPTLTRWYDLIYQQLNMEGYKIRIRLRPLAITLFTFDENYKELERVIDSMKPSEQSQDLTIFEFGNALDLPLKSACRCLQNFASSALVLVEHTRILYRKEFEANNSMPAYNDKISSLFAKNGLHHFVQGLRNYIIHFSAPMIGFNEQRSFTIDGSTMSFDVYMEKERFLAWEKWNKPARAFLEACPLRISLKPIVSDYYRIVIGFHDWLRDQFTEIYRQPLCELELVESELRNIAETMRDDHRRRMAKDQSTDEA